MATNRYRAFVSYSHADARWARWIQRALEGYRVPAKLRAEYGLASDRLYPVFRDRDELSSAARLGEAIESALAASDNLIVVCSPAAAKSRWVDEEVKAFKAQGRGDRIFCLIVDGEPGNCFPPSLAQDEPLGVDVRAHADGKWNAKLKIIAGMLGIPFGDLKDREQRRRARIFAAAAAASVVLAGVMTALAISAVLAGREAERSRALAAKSLEDAEAVAAFLSTMLTDIDPEAMGRTIVDDIAAQGGVALPPAINGTNTARLVLEEHLLRKASEAVQAQFATRPGINARLDDAIGASYYAIGLYGRSVERYAHAVALYGASYGVNDARTLQARANLATAYLYDGRVNEAVAEYEGALGAARAALDPADPVVLSTMNGLAMAYVDMERLKEARTLLEELVPAMERSMGAEHPHTLETKNNFGWVLYTLGEHEAAERTISVTLAAQRRVLGPEAVPTLSTLNNLALTYRALGRLDDAEAAHREECAIGRRTMGDAHPEVLISMLNLSRVLVAANKQAEAAVLLADALDKARDALPPVHPLLAAIATENGEVALADGRRDEARALFQETRRIYEQMFEPGHPRFEKVDELLQKAAADAPPSAAVVR